VPVLLKTGSGGTLWDVEKIWMFTSFFAGGSSEVDCKIIVYDIHHPYLSIV